jgi:muramoyltetrapeptide carboxypeptidase
MSNTKNREVGSVLSLAKGRVETKGPINAQRDMSHIRLIAPASPSRNIDSIPLVVEKLISLGFRVTTGASISERRGFLAGTDRMRMRDLELAFKNRAVDAVMSLRGGYGSQRLLPCLDLKGIASSLKPLIGFSDITALNLAIAKNGGWALHGPTAESLVADLEISTFSLHHLRMALLQPTRERSITEEYPKDMFKIETLRRGVAKGRLLGGNLSILTSLIGTSWFPNLRNSILFLEEVGEQPYRIDRMLTQLLNSGALEGVKGIAIGIFSDCDVREPRSNATSKSPSADFSVRKALSPTWIDVVRERLGRLKIPTVLGLPFGHVPFNATIPVGQIGVLDGDEGDLILGGRGAIRFLQRVK